MKRLILFALMAGLGLNSTAQNEALKLDDNEFLIGKKVVAEVKLVKLGFLKGRELRLLNSAEEILLTVQTKTIHDVTPPTIINYANIFAPALNDSFQVYADILYSEGIKVGSLDSEDAWAEYLFNKKIINEDGSFNIENVKTLRNRYPTPIREDIKQKRAYASQCEKAIKTPTVRNVAIAAKVSELTRETTGDKVVIEYKVEHDGVLLGKIKAKGDVVNLSNERAEVDFKTKIIYKKTDIEPMAFEIFNTIDCKLATYSPMSKVLLTVRADKGGSHGIMKPILDGKAESVKTRLEVVSAIVDYLIKLGYY